jgi:hypothetical protein
MMLVSFPLGKIKHRVMSMKPSCQFVISRGGEFFGLMPAPVMKLALMPNPGIPSRPVSPAIDSSIAMT